MPKSTLRKCSWKTSICFVLRHSASGFELETSFKEWQYIDLFRFINPWTSNRGKSELVTLSSSGV